MSCFAEIRRAVLQIPRGKVATYGQVARTAGYPGMARQVAWALRGMPARGIPWQRVLGRGGRILLKGESGLRQRNLLEMEGVRFIGPRVDMAESGFQISRQNTARRLRKPRPGGSSEQFLY